MKSLFRYIIFLILLNFSFAAKAESIYPIQLYAAMLPPYTNCLGDYINADMNRLKLSAVVRDMSKHGSTMSISVLMRVKSGNTVYLETTTPVQQIINVQGAMVDIRTENLFTAYDNNAKILAGRGNFMNNGYCLPEGAYEFVYQVFDGTNKKLPLSEPISIFCFLNQAEPPVGITPLDGECLDSKTNQNIVFSWMDAVAIGPKYRVYSVEVKEENGAMLPSQTGLLPMFGAQSEVNNFSVVTEKSYNTNTLIMQNTSGKFQEGKTYLWRVKAEPTKVNGTADENFAYKNEGYSEWMSFKYGGCGDSVVIPKADSIDMNLRVDMTTVDTSEETGSVVVHWQDIFDNTEVDKYCAYELYIYKADNESAAKTIIPIKDGETKEYTFDNLERGETYKSYIVGLTGCGTPDTIRTPHSDTVSFKLKKPESDSCNVNIDPAKCGKDDLIENLEKGNTFSANDHDVIVTITECNAGSVAGSYSGSGIVSCTIFKDKIGLNVKFKDILVNKSKELCMGEVEVVTSKENNLLINLNDLTGKKRTAPKAPSQDYPYTKKVATLDELKKDVEQYKGEVVLVGDNEIYAVGNDGEIEEVGKIVENACRPSKQSLDNSAGLVVFDVDNSYNDPKWTPYIDKSPSPFTYAQIVNGYERIGSYVVPWVSMVQGEARYIKATIQGKTKTTGTGLSGMEKDIKFYCVTDSVMTELNSEYKDGAFKIKVFGGQPDRKLTIVAMMNSTGSADECAKNSKTIGETNIYTMSYRKKTIHLVPVCMDVTGEMGDPKTYADRINKVFAPLGRSYEFKFEDKFENEEVKALIASGLNTEDGGNVFNNKTPEMKQLCRLYKHDENVKIDHRADAYVFLLNQNTNSDIKGYMPRTNSEGFVFTLNMNVNQIAETMTHELCHGLYGLEHTFTYGVDKNAVPENIMSYSTQIGRSPSKYFQWYNIENPSEYHFPFTDSAEDGEWTTDGHYYTVQLIAVNVGIDYDFAKTLGKWSEWPDTDMKSDQNAEERDTWLRPGLQQKYHALTGGFHGVEMALTAYKILKTDKESDLKFLFHRFGDCFAHFNIENDQTGYDLDIPLDKYIAAIDKYFDSNYKFGQTTVKIKRTFRSDDEYNLKKGELFKIKESDKEIFYVNKDRNTFINEVIDAIFMGDFDYKISYTKNNWNDVFSYSTDEYKYEDIINDIKSYLPKAKQNDYRMYGNTDDVNGFHYMVKHLNKTLTDFASYLLIKIRDRGHNINNINDVISIVDEIESELNPSGVYSDWYSSFNSSYTYNTSDGRSPLLTAFFEYVRIMLRKNSSSIEEWLPKVSGMDDFCKSQGFDMTQELFKGLDFDQFTIGHMMDGGDPDEIVRRRNLFILYVDKITELLVKKYNGNIYPKSILINKFNSIIDVVEKSNLKNKRLDAILAYEIAKYETPSLDEFSFDIPIKYIDKDHLTNLSSVVNYFMFHPEDDVDKCILIFNEYMEKSGESKSFEVTSVSCSLYEGASDNARYFIRFNVKRKK